MSGKLRKRLELAELAYESQVESDCKTLANFLHQQWPCSAPSAEGSPESLKVDLRSAMDTISEEWRLYFQNLELSNHIAHVQQILDLIRSADRCVQGPTGADEIATLYPTLACPAKCRFRLQQLMCVMGPERIEMSSVNSGSGAQLTSFREVRLSKRHAKPPREPEPPTSHAAVELDQIVKTFIASDSAVRKQYGLDLKRSLDAFLNVQGKLHYDSYFTEMRLLPAMIAHSHEAMQGHLMRIRSVLEAQIKPAAWLIQGDLWPCISPIAILEQLRSISFVNFGQNMRETLVEFALSVTACQHARRLEDAQLKGQ